MTVTIISYGMGNVRSVANAIEAVGGRAVLAEGPAELASAERILLPGVGAFGEAMRRLNELGFVAALAELVIGRRTPFLGICLGMQLLASRSFEHGEHRGFGWIVGDVRALSPTDARLRVPHIGWNSIRVVRASPLLADLPPEPTFYFVHGFHLTPADRGVVSGESDYGGAVVATIEKGHIFGTQFHPEKSHRDGLTVLRNFLKLDLGRLLKKRLIPVLLLQNGQLVRSELFRIHQVIGNPIHEVARFNEWSVDELIYLDISRDDRYDQGRDDHAIGGLNDPLSILDAVSRSCFMPLTWGGRIRSVEDMSERFRHGADKITINSACVRRPDLITEGARSFGSQAIVVSIDVGRRGDGFAEVMIDGGRTATGLEAVEWAKEAESRGAGELLLQSVERDGTGKGYDLKLISRVAAATAIPVIACSGVGRYEDYVAGIRAGASAVAAANIWHFRELADRGGKRVMARAGIDVRV